MAKKVVATLKKEDTGAGLTKIIKAVKSPKTGAYCFKEQVVPAATAKEALNELK